MIRIDHSTSIEAIEAIMAQGLKCCLNASIISGIVNKLTSTIE